MTAVSIAPDGTWLAATSDNGHVLIWDTATGELISTFISVAAATPTAVAIAPDGTWLATVHESSVRIWDTRTGSIRTTLAESGARVTAAAIAPDSARLATVSADGTLQVRDPESAARSQPCAPTAPWKTAPGALPVTCLPQRAIPGSTSTRSTGDNAADRYRHSPCG